MILEIDFGIKPNFSNIILANFWFLKPIQNAFSELICIIYIIKNDSCCPLGFRSKYNSRLHRKHYKKLGNSHAVITMQTLTHDVIMKNVVGAMNATNIKSLFTLLDHAGRY